MTPEQQRVKNKIYREVYGTGRKRDRKKMTPTQAKDAYQEYCKRLVEAGIIPVKRLVIPGLYVEPCMEGWAITWRAPGYY